MTIPILPFHSPPYFGWSRANPPDRRRYEIPIGTGDFFLLHREGDNLVWPRYSLIDRLFHELTDPDGPRFAVITGLRKMLGFTDNQIHTFQTTLMKRLARILNVEPPSGAPTDWNGLSTTHRLHFDGPYNVPIISLSYGPFEGLDPGEGVPRLGDFKQWVTDVTSSKLADITGLADLREEGNNKPDPHAVYKELERLADLEGLARLEEMDKVMAPTHAIELDHLDCTDDTPIIVINNDIATGVAHGATPIIPPTHDKDRPLFREILLSSP